MYVKKSAILVDKQEKWRSGGAATAKKRGRQEEGMDRIIVFYFPS